MYNYIIPIFLVIIYVIYYYSNNIQNKKETFISNSPAPNNSPAPDNSPAPNNSPAPDNSPAPSLLKQSNQLKPLKKIEIKLELININPLFSKENGFYLDQNSDSIPTDLNPNPSPTDLNPSPGYYPTEWNEDYKKSLCTGCVCDPKGKCGFKKYGKEYVCALVCNKFKNDYPLKSFKNNCPIEDTQKNVDRFFNKTSKEGDTDNDNKLCNFLRKKVELEKNLCIFPKVDNKVKLYNRNCFSFYKKDYNNYYKNEIIIFRIILSNKVEKLDILKIYYISNGKKIIIKSFILFFNDNKECYFYMNPKNLLNFEGKIKLIIELKIENNNKNIFEKKNMLLEIIKSIEYLPNYDEEIGNINIIKKEDFLSYLDDDYQLNYIKNSKINSNKISSGYSVSNDVKNYGVGEFKRYNYKDSQFTWPFRADINRPWINSLK